MMRRPVTLAMLLLLGAAINVAVAWGCAIWDGVNDSGGQDDTFPPNEWAGHVPIDWPSTPDWGFRHVGAGLTFTFREVSVRRSDPLGYEDLYRVLTFDVGVPMRCLRWELHGVLPKARGTLDYFPDESVDRNVFRCGLQLGHLPRNQDELRFWRRLPLCPLWSGFALNTLFYAAVCWLLFAVPVSLRRRHRRRRGRCAHCGYDLRGRTDEAAACPECGEVTGSSS